ncbi:CBS domain-containing protein [Streptomyces fructofermentans]|uniref:CBS domain-containing protein n=1 Tax=Streptomyces fructofermentans TaxID=152141 RepID=UPI00379263E5
MTPVETQPGPSAAPSAADRVRADGPDATVPQVWGDMTVEVALSVMASARTEHLFICDDDGRRVGVVTHALLAGARGDVSYTDRVRLCDLPADTTALLTGSRSVITVAGTRHAVR